MQRELASTHRPLLLLLLLLGTLLLRVAYHAGCWDDAA
jgi:hypothetical protein